MEEIVQNLPRTKLNHHRHVIRRSKEGMIGLGIILLVAILGYSLKFGGVF